MNVIIQQERVPMCLNIQSNMGHVVTAIKRSPVLKSHLILVMSYQISYEFNLF
jgi:hypothetical protein